MLGRFLLNYYLSIHRTKEDSPLHYAVDEDRVDIFKILAGDPYFEDFNIENVHPDSWQWHNTILGNACVKNRVEIVDFFMNLQGDRKIDFRNLADNGETFLGCTLFQEACRSGSDKVVQLFLNRADELNINLNSGGLVGPFILAANYAKSKPVLDLLLKDKRIDVGETDKYGYTALHKSFKESDENTEIIDTLLQSPRINLTERKNLNGFTALHVACCNLRSTNLSTMNDNMGHVARIEAFLKEAKRRNIDIHVPDNYGNSFVHFLFKDLGYLGNW